MKLIFLDRASLKYKDNAYCSSEFELILDSVVKQKSNFKVNKLKVNAGVGDLVVIQGIDLNYIGIVTSIKQNTDKTTQVQLNDFKELFNLKAPITSYEGDVCEFLKNVITEALITNLDAKQNLKYLTVVSEDVVYGSFNYEENTLINIEDLIELVTKTYGVVLTYEVQFLRGRFNKIELKIRQANRMVALRYDFKAISNLEIKESENNTINKCIFYPKSENETYKETKIYYLLTDGSITEDQYDEKRFNYVNVDSSYYGDKEFETLLTKAQEKMISSSNDHQITFTLDATNRTFIPLKNIFLGFFIDFYAKDRVYSTMLTQIKYKNTFKEATLTLGEQRNSLTDKIKMMNGGSSDNRSVINVSTNINDLDGGTY